VTRAFGVKCVGFNGGRVCSCNDCAKVPAEAVNRHSTGSAEDAASSGKAVAEQSKAVKIRELQADFRSECVELGEKSFCGDEGEKKVWGNADHLQ
jgi:hypothetical protein